MASTLPDLTWQRTNLFLPSPGTSPAAIITSIIACISSTDWIIRESAADFILISPPVTSATPNLRILIGSSAAVSPNAAQMDITHTTALNRVYFGLAPESGKNLLTNPWTSASNPFDTDRFTKFLKCTPDVSVTAMTNLYAIYSDEAIALFFQNAISDSFYGFISGAIIAPPDDADGEVSTGRVWGNITSGEPAISPSFMANTGSFLGTSISQSNYSRAFLPYNPTIQDSMEKMTLTSLAQPRHTTSGGGTFLLPLIIHQKNAPFNMLGVLRQIALWSNAQDRQLIQDSLGNDKAIIFSARRTTTSTSIAFYNNT